MAAKHKELNKLYGFPVQEYLMKFLIIQQVLPSAARRRAGQMGVFSKRVIHHGDMNPGAMSEGRLQSRSCWVDGTQKATGHDNQEEDARRLAFPGGCYKGSG